MSNPRAYVSSMSVPPSLATIPLEILTIIISHIDRPSAISLSRVSRKFPTLCDHVIWRDVAISPDLHYGEYPLVQPLAEGSRNKHWARSERIKAESRYQAENQRLLREMMVHADRRKLGMIASLTVSARLESKYRLVTLLEDLSPTLRLLEIKNQPYFTLRPLYPFFEMLDYNLISPRISFPTLTHAYLGSQSIGDRRFIPFLCNSAPNLALLFVDIEFALNQEKPEHDRFATFSSYRRDTRLKELRITTYQSYGEPVMDPDGHSGRMICELLARSPDIQRLSLDYYGGHASNALVVKACTQLPHLTEFYWEITHCCLLEFTSETLQNLPCTPLFPRVKRMLLSCLNFQERFDDVPQLPLLEHLYQLASDDLIPPRPTLPISDIANAMICNLGAHLRASPRLHTIHHVPEEITYHSLSEITESRQADDITARISSYTHSGRELLHAQILSQLFPILTILRESYPEGTPQSPGYKYVFEQGPGATVTVFENRTKSAWQHYTDFYGVVVPIEIIEKMRIVEGSSEEEWEGRGIEVGEAAWKVLTDWEAAQDATEASLGQNERIHTTFLQASSISVVNNRQLPTSYRPEVRDGQSALF